MRFVSNSKPIRDWIRLHPRMLAKLDTIVAQSVQLTLALVPGAAARSSRNEVHLKVCIPGIVKRESPEPWLYCNLLPPSEKSHRVRLSAASSAVLAPAASRQAWSKTSVQGT